MIGLRVLLLGGFDARFASGESLDLPSRKAQALLAVLGVPPGQGHPRDKLAALLWAEKSDDQARDGLRHALVALRKALAHAGPSLRADGQTLALDPARVEIDVSRFERLVAEGTPEALKEAGDLYRGDLLVGFNVNEPLFEEWLVAERARLRELALAALARLLAHETEAASVERAIQTAVRLLGLDPLQEPVHRTLMRLYVRQGRRGAALKQYQVCVAALRRELGTEPEEETRQLYQDLLRRRVERPESSDVREGQPSPPARGPAPVTPDLPDAGTPLFGRGAELARLRQMLDEASGGRGRIATVVGEAGMGKTRLVNAVAADALSLGCRVLIGRCHESDSILPFGPWVDACRSGGLSADEETLVALHPTRRAELVRLFPEMGKAKLPRASDSALPLFESMAELLERVAARRPLMLVLEDLHWADEMSLRLLAFVSRRLPAWAALLVATAREDELPDASMAARTVRELSRAPHAEQVPLRPLSRPETALLVRALARVGSDAGTVAGAEERIWAMSEGNPLVVVEAMRAFASRDRSAPAHEQSGELDLPASVRDLVARRLDRLSERGQDLVAVAAVIGRRLDFALLQAASGLDEREAARAVDEMVRHHVLQTVGDELDFTHDRVRDVVYDRLLAPRRRVLHRAVVAALEATGTVDATEAPVRDRHDERIEQLAHHALRGELWEKAGRYLRQAGEKAAARSALQDARTWLRQALGALQTQPESRSILEETFATHLALRSVLSQLGEFPQVLELLKESGAIAERLDDDARRGHVYASIANVHSRLEDPDRALANGGRALEIATRLGDLRLRILATSSLVLAHYYRGEYTRVVELATANLAALPPEWAHEFFGSSQPPSVNNRFRLLVGLAHLGRFAEAAAHEAEAIRLAEATQHAYTIYLAYQAAGMLHLLKGDWVRANALFERQISVLRTANIVADLPLVLGQSARVLAHLGDASLALSRFRESEQLLEQRSEGTSVAVGSVYASLGRAGLLLGRVDEAQRLAERAVASAAGRVDFLPYVVHLLGDIATHRDRFDAERGGGHYCAALALAESRGMRPLAAQCHLGLGRLHARTGERAQATEHFETAAAMYGDMDMPYWLEQVEAESRPLV